MAIVLVIVAVAIVLFVVWWMKGSAADRQKEANLAPSLPAKPDGTLLRAVGANCSSDGDCRAGLTCVGRVCSDASRDAAAGRSASLARAASAKQQLEKTKLLGSPEYELSALEAELAGYAAEDDDEAEGADTPDALPRQAVDAAKQRALVGTLRMASAVAGAGADFGY
jgi:hypothetical protein